LFNKYYYTKILPDSDFKHKQQNKKPFKRTIVGDGTILF